MDEYRAQESRGRGEGGQVTRLEGKWWGVSEGFLEEEASKLGQVRVSWGLMTSFLPHLQVRESDSQRKAPGRQPSHHLGLPAGKSDTGGKTPGTRGHTTWWLSSELRSDRVTWCTDPLASLLSTWVPLGTLLNLSGPQHPYLLNGDSGDNTDSTGES